MSAMDNSKLPGKQLPDKKPGEVLTARHINQLNEAARSIRPPLHGSYQYGVNSSIGAGTLAKPPFNQRVFRITGKAEDDDGVVIPDTYVGHTKFYSEEETTWKPTDAEFAVSLAKDAAGEDNPDKRKEWKVDASALMKVFDVGDILIVYWDAQRQMYIATEDSHLQYFELKDDLNTSSNTVDAYPRYYDHLTDKWITDEDVVLTLTDQLHTRKGRKRDKFFPPNDEGSFGRAVKHTVTNLWHIVDLVPTALWLSGIIVSDFNSDASVFFIKPNPTIDFPIGAVITDQDPAIVMVVFNPNDIWGSAGDRAEIRWNGVSRRWEVVLAYSFELVDVVTNVYCEDDEIVVCTRKLNLYSPNQIDEEDCPP